MQPDVLNESGKKIKASSQSLAKEHYRSFVKTSECIDSARSMLEEMSNTHLTRLTKSVPSLAVRFLHIAY